MFRSAFASIKLLCISMVLIAALAGYGFALYTDRQQAINWSNECFFLRFDPSGETKLKKWELTVTADAFIRFRKTYIGGKQEYYSFNLRSFADMDYLGNTTQGMLRIKTKADDIIVQTYNDPKGNVDSMTTTLKIPLRNMDAERVDSLFNTLKYLKTAR